MIYVNKHKKLLFIIFGLLYFLAGYLYISGYDIKTYNIPCILAFKNTNLLHLYDRSFLSPYAFNYPPILGVIYYIIHKPVIWAYEHNFINLANLIIKLPFILIHFIILFCLYKMKHEKIFMFWMLNPIWLIITALWGQFDELFCFMIYLLIDMMYHKKYKYIWPLFAVMCLFKHQGAYFIFPILLYTCILKIDIHKKIKGFLIGLFIGIMGWCPFIWLYKDILYPIRFMLYAFYLPSGLITGCDFWLFISLFMINDTSVIIRNFGLVFIFISILIGYITYKKTHDFIISIYIYMLSVFMIMLKQLDRYFVYFFIINIYIVFISHIHVNRYKISLIIAFCCNIIFLILDSLTFDKSLIIYAIFAELIASLVFCTEYINILRYVLKNKIKQKED